MRRETQESYEVRYEDFAEGASGHLIPTVYDERAFVPDPLPPELDLGKLAFALADARAAMGELRGACRRLANPDILISPLQRLEAQTSSAMEGTFTTADELALADAGIATNPTSDAIEVANYKRALRWASRELKTLPLSGRLLKGTHRILLDGVHRARGRDKQPGEYARDQNMIGGTSIRDARFIPPPPKETEACMAAFEKYLNRPQPEQSQGLIDLALAHYQIETIHPFADGNGRIGRMLISLMAVQTGLLDIPALYMSPEIERRKDEYIDRLYHVSANSAWEGWIGYFFEVLVASCTRTVGTIDRLLDLQSDYQGRARKISRSANLGVVIDRLFEQPFVRASNVVEWTGVTDAAARTLIRQLGSLGILTEVSNTYPTIWLAADLLRLARPDYEDAMAS